MPRHSQIAFAFVAFAAVCTAMVAAPGQGQASRQVQGQGQGQTLYTGTPADTIRVRVVNAGNMEAMPVIIHEGGAALKVEVGNKVTVDPASVVTTRMAPANWEYKWVTVPMRPGMADGTDQKLTAEGAQGWEATGAVITSPNGSTILLKRQK